MSAGGDSGTERGDVGLTILHLSDPQFGIKHAFGASYEDDEFATLQGRLLDDLEHLKKEHGVDVDLVVVTGDVAEWGKRKEYVAAEGFLIALHEGLGLERHRVLMVPGNHDVNWNDCDYAIVEDEAEPPYAKKWDKFAAFFERF